MPKGTGYGNLNKKSMNNGGGRGSVPGTEAKMTKPSGMSYPGGSRPMDLSRVGTDNSMGGTRPAGGMPGAAGAYPSRGY